MAQHARHDEKNLFVMISHDEEQRRQYVERGDGLE